MIRGSTLNNNHAAYGGALETSNAVSVTQSIISNNIADSSAGAYYGFGPLTLDNGTLSDNQSPFCGAIVIRGDLIVNRFDVTGNQSGGDGGAICTTQNAWVTNSTFANNVAAGSGGAISNGRETGSPGVLYVSNSSFTANSAGYGGAIANSYADSFVGVSSSTFNANSAFDGGAMNSSGPLTMTNATISGNTASNHGGGLWNSSTGALKNVTLSDNRAALGGALYVSAGTALTNSIVANSPTGGNCSGSISSAKYSIDSDNTCALIPLGAGNLYTDPLLSGLGNYGGPTRVHMPKTGSPAINGVAGSDAPNSDQRGKPRPIGAYDIGAVERQSADTNIAPGLYLPFIRR